MACVGENADETTSLPMMRYISPTSAHYIVFTSGKLDGQNPNEGASGAVFYYRHNVDAMPEITRNVNGVHHYISHEELVREGFLKAESDSQFYSEEELDDNNTTLNHLGLVMAITRFWEILMDYKTSHDNHETPMYIDVTFLTESLCLAHKCSNLHHWTQDDDEDAEIKERIVDLEASASGRLQYHFGFVRESHNGEAEAAASDALFWRRVGERNTELYPDY